MLVAYCRLCCHCRNLAEGGCLLSWFHFMRCRYFLGHVACRNLPWQGLYVASFVWIPTKNEWFENSKFSGEVPPLKPPTPPKKGTNGPLLIQSVTLFKPAGYFNYYWNPCCLIFMTIDQWRQPTFPSFPWSGSKLFKNSSNTSRSVFSPFLYLGCSLQL